MTDGPPARILTRASRDAGGETAVTTKHAEDGTHAESRSDHSAAGAASERRYTAGDYWAGHADWLERKQDTKSLDLIEHVLAIAHDRGVAKLSVADIGGGTGLVSDGLRRLGPDHGIEIEATCYEIAPNAVEQGEAHFPGVRFVNRAFRPDDGPHDIALFADVLEHVENPWAMLRDARAAAGYLLVRQPLLTCLSNYRHDVYKRIRDAEGHITLFDARQFEDMCRATGWSPLSTRLAHLYELPGSERRLGLARRLVYRLNRTLASFIFPGFYLVGAYKAVEPR